mmetsp:Transcript_33480/g.83962  ORF Transcript_33480/g.83962 Transcript_33480/m.83962 type:complete len:225 (-) Transcript_33480:341-1015(-)
MWPRHGRPRATVMGRRSPSTSPSSCWAWPTLRPSPPSCRTASCTSACSGSCGGTKPSTSSSAATSQAASSGRWPSRPSCTCCFSSRSSCPPSSSFLAPRCRPVCCSSPSRWACTTFAPTATAASTSPQCTSRWSWATAPLRRWWSRRCLCRRRCATAPAAGTRRSARRGPTTAWSPACACDGSAQVRCAGASRSCCGCRRRRSRRSASSSLSVCVRPVMASAWT